MFFVIEESEETENENSNSKSINQNGMFIYDPNDMDYSEGNENGTNIRSEKKSIKSSLCNCSDACILVAQDIQATDGDADTNFAFKNCAPFTKCITSLNEMNPL